MGTGKDVRSRLAKEQRHLGARDCEAGGPQHPSERRQAAKAVHTVHMHLPAEHHCAVSSSRRKNRYSFRVSYSALAGYMCIRTAFNCADASGGSRL